MEEQIWKDIEQFLLPQVNVGGSGVQSLSQKLIDISNYAVYLSQLEPVLFGKVASLELEIEKTKKRMDYYLEKGRIRVDEFPKEKTKNAAMVDAYIKHAVYKEEFDKLAGDYFRLKSDLLVAKNEYNEILRKIKVVKQALDVGRTILSAMKEEIKNVGFGDYND